MMDVDSDYNSCCVMKNPDFTDREPRREGAMGAGGPMPSKNSV